MPKSTTSFDGVYEFYADRIKSARNYGLFSGDQILDTVRRCAFWDSFLTKAEYVSIINLCDDMHKKLMEDNYNEGW